MVPFDLVCSANSIEVYSPPLSDWKILIFVLNCVFSQASKFVYCLKTSDFQQMRSITIQQVASSMNMT